MKVPLIQGLYMGDINYKIDDVIHSKKCKMDIFQTTSQIKVDSMFWVENNKGEKQVDTETTSVSKVEELIRKNNELFELHFYYTNKGSFDSKIPIRDGYNILKYDSESKSFDGQYFSRNSKSEGNGGSIKVEKIK